MAALVNGTFGHALDFDDVLSLMPAHPSAVIIPALCAASRAGKLAGSAFIEAYVIGVEVGGQIGAAITVGHYYRGFHMPPGGMRVLIYPQPQTGLEGKFSLQYALAAGLLDGTYTLWSFTDTAVNRPQIHDLLARISVGEDPRCADNDPLLETRSSGSRGFVEVEAVLQDRRRKTVRVDQAPGHPSRQLTWDDIAAKFMDCAAQARLDAGKAQRALGLLTRLETCPDIGEVVALLR